MSRAHLGLAEALEPGARLDPEPVYQHYRAAGDHERARTYAVQAARRAANVLAFEHAAGLFRYALGAGETKDAARLRVELADALANAGHGRDAAEHYLDAAPPGGPEAIELRRRAADQLLLAGRTYEGVATARAVLARVKEPWPETAAGAIATVVVSRGRLILRGLSFDPRAEKDVPAEALARLDACWTIARGLAMFDPLRAAAFQSRGLMLALEAGEPYRVARALAMAANFAVTENPITKH